MRGGPRQRHRRFGAALPKVIGIDDFDLPPFSRQGGLGRVHQLFGVELPK